MSLGPAAAGTWAAAPPVLEDLVTENLTPQKNYLFTNYLIKMTFFYK